MSLTERVTRRELLEIAGGLVVSGSLAMVGCGGPSPREIKVEGVKPGEWISREGYIIQLTSGGWEDVKKINVRSDVDLMKAEAELAKSLVGTIAVGTEVESVGQVRGHVGESFISMAGKVFFAVTKESLDELQKQGTFEQNPKLDQSTVGNQKYYYINEKYINIVSPSSPASVQTK